MDKNRKIGHREHREDTEKKYLKKGDLLGLEGIIFEKDIKLDCSYRLDLLVNWTAISLFKFFLGVFSVLSVSNFSVFIQSV